MAESANVKFKIPTTLRTFTGGETYVEVNAQPPTVGAALIALCEAAPNIDQRLYAPGTQELARHINVFLLQGVENLNIRDIEGGLGAIVVDGTQIDIIPAIAGGAE